MRHHLRTAASVVAACACAASACVPAARRAGAAQGPSATVLFENQSLYEASVFVVGRGGAQSRIGTVSPGRRETLTVGGTALPAGGAVTIVARVLALRRTPSTGPLTLLPGDRIVVTLSQHADILGVLPARP